MRLTLFADNTGLRDETPAKEGGADVDTAEGDPVPDAVVEPEPEAEKEPGPELEKEAEGTSLAATPESGSNAV